MAKPKGSKFKKNKSKVEKQKRPRGGGHGFTKTKELKEFEGSIPKSTPVRSILQKRSFGSNEEEVYIVSSGSIFDEQPRLATFNQLSTTSVVTGTTTSVTDFEPEEADDDVGFFFDSTPAYNEAPVATQAPEISKHISPLSNYRRKKQNIIQDDSIYISSEDDDEIVNFGGKDDDVVSISSSEDIEMLQALSHWGSNDIMQFDEPSKKSNITSISSDEEDYNLLSMTHINQVCISDDEEDEFEVDNILLEDEMDFDSLDNVPEGLKNGYRGIIRQEKKRAKKQEKRNTMKQQKKRFDSKPTKENEDMLNKIIYAFMKNSTTYSYKLDNLTHYGRTIIVPKLAKLFQLDVHDAESIDKRNAVFLIKTSRTSIPSSYYKYTEKKTISIVKPKKTKGKSNNTTKTKTTHSIRSMREESFHGRQVASDSTPISSSNIGHKMLAAMGWKEGSSIGNNGDGIKEPVKVFMRANRRGLGA